MLQVKVYLPLEAEVKVYLPLEADQYERALRGIKERLADWYGGYTTYDATGGWIDGQGELVEEPVTVVESYVDGEEYDVDGENSDVLYLSNYVLQVTDEDVAMVTVDGQKFFAEEASAEDGVRYELLNVA